MYPNDLWITSPTENYLYRIDEGTHNITKVSITSSEPRGVYVSQDKISVYVTNKSSNTLSIFRSGIRTNEIEVGKQPWAVCEDIDGNVYVANYMSNTVTKINGSNGDILATISVDNGPRGIISDGNGDIYVSCFLTHTVCKIVNDKMVASIEVGMNPEGITCDYNNNIWVACYGSNIVSKIYRNQKILDVAVGAGPISVVANKDGLIYVANYLGRTVSVLEKQQIIDDETNIAYTSIGVINIDVGENPNSLSVDYNDNIYVTNSTSNTISIINGKTIIKTLENICANPTSYGDGTGGVIYNITRLRSSSSGEGGITGPISYDDLDEYLKNLLDVIINREFESSAEKISYSSEYTEKINVKLALDELYQKALSMEEINSDILYQIKNLQNDNSNIKDNIESILSEIDLIKNKNKELENRIYGLESSGTNTEELEERIEELENNFTGEQANSSLDSDKLGGKDPNYYANTEQLNSVVNGLVWKNPVNNIEDLKAIDNPQEGWTVSVSDSNKIYRFDTETIIDFDLEDETKIKPNDETIGSWILLGTVIYNKATKEQDGLMSKEDKEIIDNLESTYLKLSGGEITGDIIANNIYSNNNVLVFNNVAEMKASNKVKAGYTVKTLGFYDSNDGGGADYVIVDNIGEDEVDEASIIALQNELYSKLLIKNSINAKQFGAKGDGETDDTVALQTCFNYAKNGCVVITEGTYKTTEQLSADKGMKLFGYNATISSYVDNNSSALLYSGSNSKGMIEGLFLKCPNNGKSCFDIKGVGGNLTLRDCQFMFGDYGISADHTDGSSCNFLRMVNCVFTHNNKKAIQLGNLSSDTFTTSCPISMIDCLIQSCGSTTDIGNNTDTVPIAMYRMLDVVIQRLQIDNHQGRYNYRIGEFTSVENLTISNLNIEDFAEDKTKNTNLVEFAGCINVNITNTKTWNIFHESSVKPILFRFNGCNGRHHAGTVTDNSSLSNYYSYGLSGNYTNNGNWTSIYMEEDLLNCRPDILRALANPEWTNICHCANKSTVTNDQSDNSSFNGTLPANNGSLDDGFFWIQDIHDDRCMAVAYMRCKGKAYDADTAGRFVFEWYSEDSSLLRRDMVTTGGTVQDDRGIWYKIHRSDAPEGAKLLKYGFANSNGTTEYKFLGDSCINIYGWDVFIYYSKPIPNIPLVNGHILNTH